VSAGAGARVWRPAAFSWKKNTAPEEFVTKKPPALQLNFGA